MSDDGLMVSPNEADIDVQMGDGHSFDANTVLLSMSAEGDAASATATRPGEAEPAAAEKIAPPQPPQQAPQPPELATGTPLTPAIPSAARTGPQPRVTSVVPAMFVPLNADADLTQPFDPPRGRVERAKAMLETLDYYRTGVRKGFMYLADLDRQRILGIAAAHEEAMAEARAAAEAAAEAARAAAAATAQSPSVVSATGVTTKGSTAKVNPLADDETISPEEIDVMIATMRAPAVPGVDYNITTEQMNQQLPLRFPPAPGELPGGRRDTTRQLNEVVEQALMQLAGYEMHIRSIRTQWTEALEREQKLLDERFGELPGDAAGRATAQAEKAGKEGEIAGSAPDVTMSGT